MKLNIKTKYIVYFGLLVAFLFRMFNFNYEGLWNDELFTVSSAHPNLSIIEVINYLKKDIHPPLHNILCNIWIKIFDYNDKSFRLLNILFGVVGVYSVYALAKLLFNKRVGLYAMVFAVLNRYLIMYSQEVRSYGLLFLLANFSFYFFIKLIRDGFNFKNASWYIVVTTAMLYTHYFALFVIASQFFCFLFLIDWKAFKKRALKYIVTFLLPNLLFLFWVPIIFKHLDKPRGGWRDEASLSLLFEYSHDFFNDQILSVVSICLVIITFLYLIARKLIQFKEIKVFFNKSNYGLVVLITWFVVFFFIPFIKSSFSDTMMFNRYFVPLITPIIIILAFYVSKIKSKNLREIVLISIIGYSILVLFLNDSPYFEKATTFRETVENLKEKSDDPYVLHIANNWRFFDYYLRQYKIRKIKSNYKAFRKMIDKEQPDEYYVLLNLKQIPEQFKKGVPSLKGYKEANSKIFNNSNNINGNKLIKYTKTNNLHQVIKPEKDD